MGLLNYEFPHSLNSPAGIVSWCQRHQGLCTFKVVIPSITAGLKQVKEHQKEDTSDCRVPIGGPSIHGPCQPLNGTKFETKGLPIHIHRDRRST